MRAVFFQDDWYHLYQISDKTFLQVLKYFNLWQNSPDIYRYYRPLSSKIYFFLSYKIFGLKSFPYLLVNIGLFFLNLFLFNQITKKINHKKYLVYSVFFYLFSLANFTFFSYISTVDNLIFGVFTFAAILAWLKLKPKIAILSFLLALASRESAIMIPFLLLFYELVIKNKKFNKALKSLIPWFSILGIYLFSRTFIYGWPKLKEAYQVSILGPHLITNVFKYLQWNLNLTGLVKQTSFPARFSFLLGLLILIISVYSLARLVKNKTHVKLFIFSTFWWLIFLTPVLFFPHHRDPWNLLVASGGMSICLGQVVQFLGKKKKVIFITSYLFLFFLGLNFYRQHHWTVVRRKIVVNSFDSILKQCQEKKVVISGQSEAELRQRQYSWYYDLGPKVLCQNKNLKVEYQLENYLSPTNLSTAQEGNFLNLVFLIRDKKQWLNQEENWLEKYLQLIEKNPATWLLEFDALGEKETVFRLKNLGPNQEIGLLMEVTPSLAEKLKLPYDKLAAAHEPQNLFLSGYSISQKQKIIDELFATFKKNFGFYPQSVGAWFIDSWSLNYLKEKYGVSTALLAAEQYLTDHHTIRGHPWQMPYYPSKNHALKPASYPEEKLKITIIQWASRDPIRGYGPRGFSNFSVQANDYSKKRFDEKYFSQLFQVYFNNPYSDFNQLTVGIEVGQEGAQYYPQFQKLFSEVLENDHQFSAKTMAEFGKIFQARYPGLGESKIVFWALEPEENKDWWAVWFNTNNYRAGLIGNQNKVYVRDLRSYTANQDDLSFLADKRKELFRQTEAIVDEVSLKKRELLIENPQIAKPQIIKDGENYILDFGQKQIKLNENNLWQSSLSGISTKPIKLKQKADVFLIIIILLLLFLAKKYLRQKQRFLSLLVACFSLAILLFEVWVLTPFNDLSLLYLTKIKSFKMLGQALLNYVITPISFVFLSLFIFKQVKKQIRSLVLAILGQITFFFPPNLGWFFPLYRKLALDPGLVTGLKTNTINFIWYFQFPSLDKLNYAFSEGQMHLDFFNQILSGQDLKFLLLPLALAFFLIVNFPLSFSGLIYLLIKSIKTKKSLKLVIPTFLLFLSPLTVNKLDVRLLTIGEVALNAVGTVGAILLISKIAAKKESVKIFLSALIILGCLPSFISLIKRNYQLGIRLNQNWSDKKKVQTVIFKEKNLIDCFSWQLNPKIKSTIYFPLGIEQYYFFDPDKIKNKLEITLENSYSLIGEN